jgi:sulfoquinovosyltransferase
MWALIRAWSRAADVMLVTSSVMATELAKHACRDASIALWRRGVDVDIFNPSFATSEARHRMSDGHPDAPLLVYVGRLGAEKNLIILKDVLAANPGARLALVGDGPARASLQAHFANTPTVFTGMLSGTELSAAFASADIFVMPSETETLGFVVLEAMASGLPVVAVAAGGIPDIITAPGQTGMLYPAGDVAAASAAVASLIADRAAAAAMGAAGRADVARWGWPAASRHLREELYTRAIARAAATRRFGRVARRVRARRALALATRALVAAQPALAAASALVGLALVAAVASATPPGTFASALSALNGLSGASAHIALAAFIAAMGALPLVPMQPLAALAGYLFGAAGGLGVAWAGVTGAAVAAYWTARLRGRGPLLRDWLLPVGEARPFMAAQLRAVAAAAAAGGVLRGASAVAALRLRPLAPFSLSNYLCVETRVRASAFFLGTAAGMLPWCALYAAAGAASRGAPALAVHAADALVARAHGVAVVGVAMAALAAYALWPQQQHGGGEAAARRARGAARRN